MTDKRELLELAARAAGIEHPGGEHSIENDGRLWDCERLRWWNPLTDDGDCARLEAAVLLDLCWCDEIGEVTVIGPQSKRSTEHYSDHNNDRQAARRLASTRAAAEVGRGMKP